MRPLPARDADRNDDVQVNEDLPEGWRQPAGLLESDLSQVLLLKDALDSGEPAAIARAFAFVSRVCGLGWLAAQAGCDRDRLFAALADGERPDVATLSDIVDRLLRRGPPAPDASGARFED